MYVLRQIGLLVLAFLFATRLLYASDITSTNFIIRDPVLGTGSGFGTSSSFQFFGAGNTLFSDGAGTSASFKVHEGFLYYPEVTDVVLTAVANGATGELDWTAAVATTGLGWTVSGYNTGIATVSGGPYSYTAVGNVLSYDYTSLTPGQYCFVVQTLDGLGYVIGTSNEQCITIQPTLTFSNDDATIGFGTLSAGGVRYANAGATGSGTRVTAHTMLITTNAPGGYTLSYRGPTLSSGANTIPGADINGDADGTPGTAQFAIAGTETGGGAMSTDYNAATPNWDFIANTTTTLATAGAPTTSSSIAMEYLANITTLQASGQYSTDIAYVVTGNF